MKGRRKQHLGNFFTGDLSNDAGSIARHLQSPLRAQFLPGSDAGSHLRRGMSMRHGPKAVYSSLEVGALCGAMEAVKNMMAEAYGHPDGLGHEELQRKSCMHDLA